MTNFLLIYTGGWGVPDDEEGQAKVKAAWGTWLTKLGAAIQGGDPLGAGRYVSAEGAGDGAGISPAPSGYMIIAAESLDDAVAKVRDHPHVRFGGQVSVYEPVRM